MSEQTNHPFDPAAATQSSGTRKPRPQQPDAGDATLIQSSQPLPPPGQRDAAQASGQRPAAPQMPPGPPPGKVGQYQQQYHPSPSQNPGPGGQSQPLPPQAWPAERGQKRSSRGERTQQTPVNQAPPALPQPILFPEVEIDMLETIEFIPPQRRQRLGRPRRWLRSRVGRIVVPLITLVLGAIIGLSALLWYGLAGEGALIIVPPSVRGNLIIDADKTFVSQLVSNQVTKANLPGQVKNITTELENGDLMIVQGDDTYTILGLSFSRHFTVDLQPYVANCVVQVRVTKADLGGIPITTFVQSFQSNINQQLGQKATGLPQGFTYCTVGVRTEPGGMFVTYQATPVAS